MARRAIVDGVRLRRSAYPFLIPPSPTLWVVAGRVTTEAFHRFTADLGPHAAAVVPDLGDRATFDRATSTLRVLSGSTLFVVSLSRSPLVALQLAIALARKVLARLDG